MLTCEEIYILTQMDTYEEIVKIFNIYDLPVDYILRTCFALDI